jgi:hypothetical protein
MLDAPITPDALLARLDELSRGLLFPSEQDHPLTPVRWGEVEPSPDALRVELDVPAGTPVKAASVRDLFAPLLAPPDEGGVEPADAQRYRDILGILEQHLTALSAYEVGRADVDILVLGQHPSGVWLGLRTRVVET